MAAGHAYVLTPNDVRHIRNYVGTKYAGMPVDKRAEIVADAVSKIIHRQLPDFEAAIKYRVTSQLIRTTVLEQQRPVGADDIYRACLELDQEDDSVRIPLRRWIDQQTTSLDAEQTQSIGRRNDGGDSICAVNVAGVMPLGHIRRMRRRLFLYGVLSLLVVASAALNAWSASTSVLQGERPSMIMPIQEKELPPAASVALNELPSELRYADIDIERLTSYLRERNSMLAEHPYMEAILHAAKQFDIHPALLFAITGQEQAFVPISNKRALEIANNPFNVFHSWEEFNTTIEQSSAIAARTINRLSKDRPAGTDPIVWINREYAEDPNWSKGVSSILKDIQAAIGSSSPLAIK
jgi:hypothetical protein